MKRSTAALTAIIAAGTIACASKPIPVPVVGTSDVSALVGQWSGEYTNPENGRSGSIEFALRAGADTAYGSIVMQPRSVNDPSVRNDQVQAVPMRTGVSQVLSIRFVRVQGNEILGRLDPYKDPDCGCSLMTTFHGVFKDSKTIEGTFETKGSGFDHVPSSGKWRVTKS